RRMERRPGQKEDRFEHLLGGEAPAPEVFPEPASSAAASEVPAPQDGDLLSRVQELEAEVARLRTAVDTLGAQLGSANPITSVASACSIASGWCDIRSASSSAVRSSMPLSW